MGLILLTFVIGALNLFVGYALAVRLGYGPPTLNAPLYCQPLSDSGEPTITDDDFEAMLNGLVETDTDSMLDSDDGIKMDIEPSGEPYDAEAAALLKDESPEIWDLNEKYVETSILKLNVAMMKSGARATGIDTQLRSVRGNSDQETILECCSRLKEDCEVYLAEQSEAARKFLARINELGELTELGEEIEFANKNQASQIETTVSNLKHMDCGSDLEAANSRLLEEIANLREARHHLRDNQEVAFLTIARHENRMDTIAEKLYHDALTGVRNRIGLEVALSDWWQQKRHHSRSISAVLFDLDHFGLRNEEHGCLIGDRLLYQVAQIVLSQVGGSDMLGRFAGQRFLLMAVDSGPQAAIKVAETIRQRIAQTTFVHETSRITLTVSGGVTEVSSEDDSYLDVFARIEEALAAAKNADRNCTFGCKRNELERIPERIEAPRFGIESQEIEI